MWQFLDLKSVLDSAEDIFGLVLKVDFTLAKPTTGTVVVISTVDFTAQKNMTK